MTRKRSEHIDLGRMRKQFVAKPVALSVAAIFLSACGDSQEATVYANPDECIKNNPDFVQECKTAYEEALAEAQRTGPKYNTMGDCESEFGRNQCYPVQQQSGSFFMPFMAGYMLSNLLSPNRYSYQPLFTSYSPYSPYRYRWIGAGGYDYGDIRKRNYRVDPDAFKPKPTVTKTMKRGGFGSTVRAKSSWGKSSSKGWGG